MTHDGIAPGIEEDPTPERRAGRLSADGVADRAGVGGGVGVDCQLRAPLRVFAGNPAGCGHDIVRPILGATDFPDLGSTNVMLGRNR
jgi:hypothetical protein